ncbi:peptidoglycan-binding protein [Streptomyces spinosirectus]|uniref:peptidoglycan-binding domain-containing protein n=1 Tax=Streptomyces TaxID=1883 RepID=UPI001C9DB18A|nr:MULTISPECIES: peptidoglycan-binding domain-containing protein [Streptomyces]MBY8339625.1 peptidoglycan-binding protein [Streptomyces plumbidurans]UIR15701.1 peptidoglycan-binding protein [Streptomyces spinosirectus]
MSELAGPSCPECGKPRAADGTPTCSCARRASDVHRKSRTAEAAAAEDFDPVRIRPFVDIDANSGAGVASTDTVGAVGASPETETETETETATATEAETETAATSKSGAESQQPDSAGELPEGTSARRRRPRALVVTGVGAAAAVVVAGGIVGGLFWYDGPSREGSVSGGVRAGLPQERPSGQGPSSSRASHTPSSSAQSSATTSSSPSATSADGRVAPTGADGPSGSAPAATATTTAPGAPVPSVSDGKDPILRFGDKGPEVVELQLRLRQIGYYRGDADGDYDRDVESAVRGYQLTRVILKDESGVYGVATRASLEAETKEP